MSLTPTTRVPSFQQRLILLAGVLTLLATNVWPLLLQIAVRNSISSVLQILYPLAVLFGIGATIGCFGLWVLEAVNLRPSIWLQYSSGLVVIISILRLSGLSKAIYLQSIGDLSMISAVNVNMEEIGKAIISSILVLGLPFMFARDNRVLRITGALLLVIVVTVLYIVVSYLGLETTAYIYY